MRQRGASGPEVAAAMPEELLTRVGYYGAAAGARAAFETLGDGLDTASCGWSRRNQASIQSGR